MSASFEVSSRECVYIKISLAAKTPFPFLVSVYTNSSQFDALDGKRKIYEALGITRFYFIPQEIVLWDCYQGRIVFIENLHAVGKHMPDKPEAVLQVVIIYIIMNR